MLVEEVRKNPFLQPISSLIGTSIHEQILAPRMSVNIAVEEDISAFKSLPHHLFTRVVFGLVFAGRTDPLSIKILATERTSVISIYNTIRIQHRDYLEDEVIPEVFSSLFIAHEVSQDAMHDERGIALTRMHP